MTKLNLHNISCTYYLLLYRWTNVLSDSEALYLPLYNSLIIPFKFMTRPYFSKHQSSLVI